MYKPQFPYKDNQIILSSDRITLYSRNDSIFLFGTEAVSLSSTKTVNLDATNKILLNSPKIELGNQAETFGEPIILGNSFLRQMIIFLERVNIAAEELSNVSESNLAGSFVLIQGAGITISKECNRLITLLRSNQTPVLSKTTFTR